MSDAQPAMGRGEADPRLELRGISKSFPGVRALTDVSLSIWPAETHMLLGENGAGKSTLMKVLCGAVSADAGEILYDGRPVRIASPADARKLGIAVIFQEFSLVPHLDVAQNVFLGRMPAGRVPGTVDRRRLYAETRRILETIGFDIDPRESVHSLGVAHQQMVEIAKALSQDARILVMDEPTAALSDRESERLFAMMAKLKANGVGIVYISHRMAEVFALGDRITVLRDGQRVQTLLPGEATPGELVRLMVGRSVDTTYPRQFRKPGATMLEVRGVSSGFWDQRHRPHGARGGNRRSLRPRWFGANRGRARGLRRRQGDVRRSSGVRPHHFREPGDLDASRHGADPREPEGRGTGAYPHC